MNRSKKFDLFQKKVIKLWEEQKETGLVIETARQIGKTTVALEIAGQEVMNGNRVRFYSFKESIINNIKKQYFNKFGMDNIHLIEFKLINDTRISNFKPKYTIYDESLLRIKPSLYDRVKEPNTIKFFTEIESGYYRFDYTWLDNKKIDILELRLREGHMFEKEYNCCMVEKDEK